MKQALIGLVLLTLGPHAFAADIGNKPYANPTECKAYYTNVKAKDVQKLKEKRREMGVGMPMVIYSRKMSKIESRYAANIRTCRS